MVFAILIIIWLKNLIRVNLAITRTLSFFLSQLFFFPFTFFRFLLMKAETYTGYHSKVNIELMENRLLVKATERLFRKVWLQWILKGHLKCKLNLDMHIKSTLNISCSSWLFDMQFKSTYSLQRFDLNIKIRFGLHIKESICTSIRNGNRTFWYANQI